MTTTPPKWIHFDHLIIGGSRVAIASRADLAAAMVADCLQARQSSGMRSRLVFDANGHGLSLRSSDPVYRAAFEQADLVHADGQFIVAVSKLLTKAIPERSATTDMIHDAAVAAEANGLSFFLLGGPEEVNRCCAAALQKQYPRLHIAGRHHGFFSEAKEDAVVEKINQSRADVLWAGLGKPREQIFAVRNATRLTAGWTITCGGCFNYVTGDYRRAPVWMQQIGLEWLHRMMIRPRALAWRYLLTTPHALLLTLLKTRRSSAEQYSRGI